jgi:hypothetical protein
VHEHVPAHAVGTANPANDKQAAGGHANPNPYPCSGPGGRASKRSGDGELGRRR